MDAVNVVLILIYAFSFFAEEEKREPSYIVKYPNSLVIPENYSHHYHNITMGSTLNCGTIQVTTNISPSMNSLSVFNNVIIATSSIILKKYGPYNFHQEGDANRASNISQERSYHSPPQHIYLEVPTLDSRSHSKVYPEFPTLTTTSPMDLDREIWRPYINVHMNLHHGASVRADILCMFIVVVLASGLVAGLAEMVKHFLRVNICIHKDIVDLKSEVTSTLRAIKAVKEKAATRVRQNRNLINKLEDEMEGKIHAEHTAQALRNEFLNQYEVLTKRLETMEKKIHGSKNTVEYTLKKQALDIERVVKGVNYRKKLTEMSTQTRVYPKRTGILVKERKVRMAQKKVDFWV